MVLIFSIPYVQSYFPLERTRRILGQQWGVGANTPPGVDMEQNPEAYLKPGNLIKLGIDGLGIQHQNVQASKWRVSPTFEHMT